MPFISDDDDDVPALTTEQAKRESARNVIKSLHDVMNTQVYLQDTDPETGFPIRKQLVSGGIEYFNDHEMNGPDVSEYDIDAILSGDLSIEEAMAKIESGSPKPGPVSVPPAATPVPAGSAFDKLGLPFLRETPTMPDQLVHIRFSGQASFQIPFACHAVVQTDKLVLLVTDKRSVPVFSEPDFQVERDRVHVELVLPDRSVLPVVAPVPKTVSFELGILRCTLFLRRTTNHHESKR